MTAAKTATRDIATPVTAVLFVVSTLTGIMLLLHWQAGLVRFSHEWLSLAFSAVGIWHLIKNWRVFLGYLNRRLPMASLAAGTAASAAIVALTGTTADISPKAVFSQLTMAPLEAAAPAFGLNGQAAAARLADRGFVAQPGDTLEAIARRAGASGAEIATLLARMAPAHPSAPAPSH